MRRLFAIFGVLALVAAAAAAGYFLRPVPRPAPTYDDAYAAVHATPRDPDAWIALGDAQSQLDELAAAEHAYRTALRLDRERADAYARLGFLLFGQGRDDEAKPLLAEARRRGADAPMLDTALAQLANVDAAPEARTPANEADTGAPSPTPEPVDPSVPDEASAGASLDAGTYAGEPEPLPAEDVDDAPLATPPADAPVEPPSEPLGPCDYPLVRLANTRALGIDVELGGVESRLVFDTGATITVVTTELANLMGLVRDGDQRIVARTANGRVVMESGVVGTVRLASRVVTDTRVAVCPDCTQGVADGLFGLDLVAAFGLTVDPTRGVATFDDCR